MSDDERHQVGICYKQNGQDAAIELGAALVNPELQVQRVDAWKAFIATHPTARMYCFRGGLRSRIAQHWLAQAGVDIPLVEGGYKALRTLLINELDRLCSSMSFTIIGGRTGIGKTLLLEKLGTTLDLEKLANHRGSSFGSMPSGQPSNIDYENTLTIALMRIEAQGGGHVYLEDEARLIGRVCNPERLRQVMQLAPIYLLESSMSQRIDNCLDDYVVDLLARYIQQFGEQAGFDAFAEHHRAGLDRIRKRFGPENHARAMQLLDTALIEHRQHARTDAYRPFIELLLTRYYDPMYDYQITNKRERIVFRGSAEEIIAQARQKPQVSA